MREHTVCSKWDISPSEGHFGVKTIMAAILKCRSNPKCSKLATSKGPSDWRISKGTTDGHVGPPWSFAQILCMMMAPPYDDAEGHFKKQLFGPLHTLQPFKALTPESKRFEGISTSEWNAGTVSRGEINLHIKYWSQIIGHFLNNKSLAHPLVIIYK